MIYKVTQVSTASPDLTSQPTGCFWEMRRVRWIEHNLEEENALDTLKTADARLQHWKRWWAVEDPYVRCTQCDATQPLEHATEPFNALHLPNCPLQSDLPQYPWRTLSAILKDVRHDQGTGPGVS